MKLQDHLNKVTWSILDKFLFIIFGFFAFVQMNYSSPEIYGLYTILVSINTWIFVLSDSFALQSIIQFGANTNRRNKVNLYSLIIHLSVVSIFILIIYLLRNPITNFLGNSDILSVLKWLVLLSIASIPRTYCLKFIYRDHKMQKLFWINFVFFGSMILLSLYYITQNGKLSELNLYFIYTIGMALSSLLAIVLTMKELRFSLIGNITFKEIFSFSIPYTITGAFHFAPRQLDILIIQLYFSTYFVGIYASAKTLFRVFEEGVNAVNGLVYPATVKAVEESNIQKMQVILTKSLSFTFITYFLIAIVLQTPITDWGINLILSEKYYSAIGQFKVLAFAAVFLPFTVLYTTLTAMKKYRELLQIVMLSSLISIATFFIVGQLGVSQFIPLGLVVYNIVLGSLLLLFINKKTELKLGWGELLSSIRDSTNYLKRFYSK